MSSSKLKYLLLVLLVTGLPTISWAQQLPITQARQDDVVDNPENYVGKNIKMGIYLFRNSMERMKAYEDQKKQKTVMDGYTLYVKDGLSAGGLNAQQAYSTSTLQFPPKLNFFVTAEFGGRLKQQINLSPLNRPKNTTDPQYIVRAFATVTIVKQTIALKDGTNKDLYIAWIQELSRFYPWEY